LAKLRVLSGRQVCRILADAGFVEIRKRGSHIVMQQQAGQTTITVPVPDHQELRRRTLMSIIRQSSLPRALFEVSN